MRDEYVSPYPQRGETMINKTFGAVLASAAAILLVAACTHPGRPAGVVTSAGSKSLSPQNVIAWAHLDDTLGAHVESIVCGEADGKAVLADYVMVLNGQEMVQFVKAHGYRSHRGPLAVRRRAMSMEVDVEITGKDGATLVISLFADGTMQGAG
jgi:hypothetical protein